MITYMVTGAGVATNLPWSVFLNHHPVHNAVRAIRVSVTSRAADRSLSATKRAVSGDEQFRVFVSRWRDETRILSSPTKIVSHPDYLRIIKMGELALPFILRELRDHGGEWYTALEVITGIDPIPAGANGYVREMKRAWLAWGESQGLI